MKILALAAACALAAVACSAEVAPPPPVAAPVAVDETANARTAAEAAFRNLRNRNFPLDRCEPAQARIAATESAAWAQSNGGPTCTVVAVKRPSGQWVVVVRSGTLATNPQARVVVAPNLQGVQKVDYAR
jgi:hypothetical protein